MLLVGTGKSPGTPLITDLHRILAGGAEGSQPGNCLWHLRQVGVKLPQM